MKYDQYLSHGYPIGSGVVESACSHVVKDRMEISGARWGICGADTTQAKDNDFFPTGAISLNLLQKLNV